MVSLHEVFIVEHWTFETTIIHFQVIAHSEEVSTCHDADLMNNVSTTAVFLWFPFLCWLSYPNVCRYNWDKRPYIGIVSPRYSCKITNNYITFISPVAIFSYSLYLWVRLPIWHLGLARHF